MNQQAYRRLEALLEEVGGRIGGKCRQRQNL